MKAFLACFIVLCFIAQSAFSQFTIVPELRTKSFISTTANLGLESDVITQKFFRAYYNGDFLDRTLKNSTLSRLTENGKLAYYSTLGAHYYSRAYSNEEESNRFFKWHIGLAYHQFLETNFSRDFYTLLLFGNAQYENKKAILSPMSFESLSYYDLSVGMLHRLNHFYVQWKIDFLLGNQFNSSSISNGSLFTEQDGLALNFDLHWQLKRSIASSLTDVNGKGIATGIKLFHQSERSLFSFELDQLGLIQWSKNLSSKSIDSTLVFTGVNIENIFDSIFVDVKNKEDLKSEFIREHSISKFTQSLPAVLKLNYTKKILNDQFSVQLAVNKILRKTAKSSIDIGIHYFINPNCSIGLVGGLPAYSRWNLGMQFSYYKTDRYFFVVQAPSLVNSFLHDQPASSFWGAKIGIHL